MTACRRPWRVGLLGTGKHGSRYARHIGEDVEGLELVAISRRSALGREQATDWGCRWYGDWREVVADAAVDCVIAALPPTLNRQVAEGCAAAGKPLLLEKPMAVTATDAAAILRLFEERGLGLTIGQTLRYNPVIRTLRRCLDGIGELHGLTANQRLEPNTLAWLDDPDQAGAGVSLHTAVHVFDALRYITGREIVRVFARSRCVHTRRLEDQLLALVELDNGVLGTVDCAKIGPARSGRFEFVGAAGQLHGDQIHHTAEWIRGTHREPVDPGPPVQTIVPLLTDWLAFLRGEAPNPVPGREGLAAVQIATACLRSAAMACWQPVQP